MASAQKQRSPVQYRQFNPDSLLPDGLLGVARPSGDVERAIAANFQGLANAVSGYADRAAADEGRRAGLAAGADKSFRPSRSSSIRGRARDAAGTKAYLQTLESNVRDDVYKAYDLHKDDPQALERALTALRSDYQKNHVFPEILGDFNAGYSKLATRYQREAVARADARQRDADNAAMIQRLEELENKRSRLLEGGTGPDTEALVNEARRESEAVIDDAVKNNRMTATNGERAKANIRTETTVGFYIKQAENFTSAADLKAFRDQMSADYAEGKLAGVDADAWTMINRQLDRQAARLETVGRRATGAIERRGDDLARRIAAGIGVDPSETTRLLADGKTAADGGAALQTAMDKIAIAQIIAGSSLPTADKAISEMREKAKNGTPTRGEIEVLAFAEASFARLKKSVTADPVGTAIARGILPDDVPFTLSRGKTADQYAGEIAARLTSAEAAAKHFGVGLKILRPGEARMVEEYISANPSEAGAIAEGLLNGAGKAAPHLLRELGEEGPMIAQIGSVMLNGGSATAARDVARGGSRDVDGKMRPAALNHSKRLAIENRVIGSAYAGFAGDRRQLTAAAEKIARARIADANIDPRDDASVKPIYERALQEAAGATFDGDIQYGGIADFSQSTGWFSSRPFRVHVPSDVRADRFADLLASFNDADLAALPVQPASPGGKPYRASDFKAAVPVAVDGGYRFAAGDPTSDKPMWIAGVDGRPFVLDFDQIAERLRVRIPEAFR